MAFWQIRNACSTLGPHFILLKYLFCICNHQNLAFLKTGEYLDNQNFTKFTDIKGVSEIFGGFKTNKN
jgi:hypothetical protein